MVNSLSGKIAKAYGLLAHQILIEEKEFYNFDYHAIAAAGEYDSQSTGILVAKITIPVFTIMPNLDLCVDAFGEELIYSCSLIFKEKISHTGIISICNKINAWIMLGKFAAPEYVEYMESFCDGGSPDMLRNLSIDLLVEQKIRNQLRWNKKYRMR